MTETKKEMDKTYDPQETEKRLYDWWQSQGYFRPETAVASGLASEDGPAWCITMPPPNVTGALHLGHAITAALEDLMTPSTVMAIEWAERLPAIPRGSVVEVRLEHDGDARRVDIRRQ